MSLIADALGWLFLLAGSFFVVSGGIGLVRMPDFFTRMHPSGVVDTLGATLVVAGLIVQAGPTQVTMKLLLILAFLFFTSPTATHAVAHAALAGGLVPWTRKKSPKKRKDGD